MRLDHISNLWILIMAGAFFPVFSLSGLGLDALSGHLAFGALGLLFGFALAIRGLWGAGVGKIFGAGMLWLGPSQALSGAVAVFLLGGLAAMAVLLLRSAARAAPRLADRSDYLRDLAATPSPTAPYWIAVPLATAYAFPATPVYAALAARFF